MFMVFYAPALIASCERIDMLAVKVREAYRRKLEMLMRDTSDMARAVAIMEHDAKTGGFTSEQQRFLKFVH